MEKRIIRVTSSELPGTRAVVEVFADDNGTDAIASGGISDELGDPPLEHWAGGDPLAAIREAFSTGTITTPQGLTAVGDYLFQVLLGELVPAWSVPVPEPGTPVAILLDIRVPDLAAVPWELISEGPQRLFMRNDLAIARAAVPFTGTGPDGYRLGPLRILVVAGTPDDKDLHVDAELFALHSALASHDPDLHGLIHVEILDAPTLAELAVALRELRPHAMHVVAHGKQSVTGSPSITLGPTGQGWELTVEHIANSLEPPPMVVLNTCHSAEVDVSGVQWSLAEAFHRRGSNAVVAMQGAIGSDAAVAFAGALYREVAGGVPVDQAMVIGRKAIGLVIESSRTDWAFPVLSITVDATQALPVPAPERRPVPAYEGFERVRLSVDRGPERRQLWTAVEPEEALRRPVLAIVGDDKVGKTDLLYSCLLTCFRRGQNVRYVTFKETRRLEWLDVVRRIASGAPGAPNCEIEGTLPEPAYSLLNYEIEELRQGREPDAAPGPGERVSPGAGPFAADTERAEGYIERIFSSLLATLESIAEPNSLVLALDDFSQVFAADVEKYVWPMLLKPVADGKVPRVRVVLASDRAAWAGLPQATRSRVTQISLTEFDLGEAPRLMQEYFARRSIPFDDTWKEVVTKLRDVQEKKHAMWPPDVIRSFDSWMD
jgi:hypothetical protein